ncbi:hypothetical protein MCOR27_004277 [Pyricularia oryzae]|uniref:Uncharacterized protein n=4 Tax=Pyricularia TaxID=48558 RepID=A0ABQ8P155_PYRGI|nr:hypothetical protein OOU_Y34scaffold00552g18 [Pyricularia oryzae Y34]KAH8846776.1 hypothetical protein MCOR01_000224 [Pyricularia oryzae]KAI6304813.1 hypothetical protein MCOR33_000326 [Pyricularia grisea]KAH9428063.1 hypothetical protein MCOR02_011555 [Pyricularia oryzae]KAI6263417.1 hypothetical protein MCOR19_000318 [Pyricularia oryzae]
MSPSPQTPLHSRHTSVADSFSMSPSMDRRQSRSSFNDAPLTPHRNNSFGTADNTMDLSGFGSGGHNMAGGGSGLGNLADELAGAFSDEEEDDDPYYDDADNSAIGIAVTTDDALHATRDSGVDIASAGGRGGKKMSGDGLGLPTPRGHRRKGSEYDGSEYGSDSDLDSTDMPPSLIAKIDAVESLARRGTESNGGPTDGVFQRVTNLLRDLGPQAGVEGSTTRLITTHTALSSHLHHQSRQIQTLSYALFAPTSIPPDVETVEELIPLLDAMSEIIPRPATAAHASLASLHAVTADVVQTLNYLSDTLAMSRQTTNTATRRLRSAKEMVAEIRREDDEREEAEIWLTRHKWGERLASRECAAVCKDVVGGFEDVCNSWRARILAQAEAGPAAA